MRGDWEFDVLNEVIFLSSFALLAMALSGISSVKASWIKNGLVWFLSSFSLLCVFDVIFFLWLYTSPYFQVIFDKFGITPFSILGVTAVKALISSFAFIAAVIKSSIFRAGRVA